MFQSAWTEIARLRAVNATHRNGDRMADVGVDRLLDRAEDELQELMDDPKDMMELGDTLSILFHFAQHQGWTPSEIEECILVKLKERFTEDSATKSSTDPLKDPNWKLQA